MRSHLGTSNNGSALWGGHENGVRCYYDQMEGGNLVAVATSQDGFENFINYFCLPNIWDQQSDTSWVSKDDLLRLAGKPVGSAV